VDLSSDGATKPKQRDCHERRRQSHRSKLPAAHPQQYDRCHNPDSKIDTTGRNLEGIKLAQ